MARYQSFAALGTILQASLEKKKTDIDKAFKALDVSMQSQLLKEKIAQQSWENDLKIKQFELDSEIKREQLIRSEEDRARANEQFKLQKWNQTKTKLDLLEGESIDLNLKSSDKFHSALGTGFQEGEDWADNLNKTLKKMGVNEVYRSRLIESSMKSAAGNSMPTSLLIEEIDVAVQQYNADPRLVDVNQQELIKFYLSLGVIEENLDGTLSASSKYNNIFSSNILSSKNLSNIDLEQNQLYMEDDTEIQSKIKTSEYRSLESQLRELDLNALSNQLKEAQENILKQRTASELGVTIEEVDLEQSMDALSAAESDIEATQDQIDMDRRKIANLQATGSIIGVDTESQIKELSKSIEENKATLQALNVTRDRAEYDRDIDYALVHLRKIATPDKETHPEHGYSNEQIDRMLEYLESVVDSGKSGRRLNRRELMEAGRYIGL